MRGIGHWSQPDTPRLEEDANGLATCVVLLPFDKVQKLRGADLRSQFEHKCGTFSQRRN